MLEHLAVVHIVIVRILRNSNFTHQSIKLDSTKKAALFGKQEQPTRLEGILNQVFFLINLVVINFIRI